MASNIGASCSKEGAAALPDSSIVLDSRLLGLELPHEEEAERYTRGEKVCQFFPSQGEFYDSKGIKRKSEGHCRIAAFFNALKGMSDNGFHQQVFRFLSPTTPPAVLEVAKWIYYSSQTADKLLPQEVLAKAVEVAFEAHKSRSNFVGKTFKLQEATAFCVAKDFQVMSGFNLYECKKCSRKTTHKILGIYGKGAEKLLKGRRATIVDDNIRCVPCDKPSIISTLTPNTDIVMVMPGNFCTVAIKNIFKKKTVMSRTIEFSNGWKFTCKACIFHLHTGDPAEVAEGTEDYHGEYRSITVLVPSNPRSNLIVVDPRNPDSQDTQQLGKVNVLFYVRMNSQEKIDAHNAKRKKDYEKERLRPKAASAEEPRTLPPRAARDAAAAAIGGEKR